MQDFLSIASSTLVNTQKGYLFANDLKVDDIVITDDNISHKVKSVELKNITDVYNLKILGVHQLICSPEHLLRVKRINRKNKPRTLNETQFIKVKDLTKDYYISAYYNKQSKLPVWNDYESTNIDNINDLFPNETFWYIMGRYVGDGCMVNKLNDKRKDKGILICCNYSDKDSNSLIGALDKLNWKYNICNQRTEKVIRIYSMNLFKFVERYGYLAPNKVIDRETLDLPHNLLSGFIKGLLDSDGCHVKNLYKLTTVSEKLAYSFAEAIRKLYKCSVRVYQNIRPETKIIESRVVNQRNDFQVVFIKENPQRNQIFIENDEIWVPFRKIDRIEQNTEIVEVKFY